MDNLNTLSVRVEDEIVGTIDRSYMHGPQVWRTYAGVIAEWVELLFIAKISEPFRSVN